MNRSQGAVAFVWHFHQPDYRVQTDAGSRFTQPWVYLHAIKDCVDMAHHLEQHASIRATINFSGVLLAQLKDYVAQCQSHEYRDPLLELLAAPSRPLTSTERLFIAEQCLRIKRETMVYPYPGYAALEKRVREAEFGGPSFWAKHEDQTFFDLLTWYHLAWCGESIKRTDPTVQKLIAKASNFTSAERLALLQVICEAISTVLPRFRSLAKRGQIELSLTPYGHPLSPLLIDLQTALAADSGIRMPKAPAYPQGDDRVRWHIREALHLFEEIFDVRPVGIWPAEAAISDTFIDIAANEGFAWVASTASVLKRSLGNAQVQDDLTTHTWSLQNRSSPRLLFRTEQLSDLFSFEYGQRSPDDAAAHFIEQVRTQVSTSSSSQPLVNITLDGENAWEHYADNAYAFFDSLYSALEASPDLSTTTPSALIANSAPRELDSLVSGSWVLDCFSMWIGDDRRNRAWDTLIALKHQFDARFPSLNPDAQRHATTLLARCESSDWFWWLGFDEPISVVREFDSAFRDAIAATYRAIGVSPPNELVAPLSRVGSQIDGRVSVERLAHALAECHGMTLSAALPDGPVSWTIDTHDTVLGPILEMPGQLGWCFAIPDLSALDGDTPGVFKYAEIKIALEKSNQRYFEGAAVMKSGHTMPGLLVINADETQARYIAQRFRLPVVAHGTPGVPGKLICCE